MLVLELSQNNVNTDKESTRKMELHDRIDMIKEGAKILPKLLTPEQKVTYKTIVSVMREKIYVQFKTKQ